MKIWIRTCIVLSLFSFMPVKKPASAPKAPFTGMTTISWIGFGNLVVSSPIPLGVTNMTAPTPFVYPKKIDNQVSFYREVLLVNASFKPGNPVTQSPIYGNWFVRRQVLSVKNGSTTLLTTSNLYVNDKAEATASTDQILPLSATHVEYQIGRTQKIVKSGGPGQLPKVTTVEVFPHDAVRIAVPTAWISANACQVKTQPSLVRPIPCEFQVVNFQLIGKSGKVIYETKSIETGPPITVPTGEWKKEEGQHQYFDAKWTVKRIHQPVFPVNKGYMVNWGKSGSDFAAEVDAYGPLKTGLQLDNTIGKEFTITVEVKRPKPNTGAGEKTGELILENDVTRTKFTATQMFGAIRGEAYIKLNWSPGQ
ncbi:hypothetical protein GCM10027299_46470 [Larkinella ripae]